MTERPQRILILGASGFIGGRIAEKLFLDHHHVARCLFRDYSKLSRIARFPLDIVEGDVLRAETLQRAARNCDVCVFSVHGKEAQSSVNWRVNTDGLRNAFEAAVTNHARQFIFLSTTAVFEEGFDSGEIDEKVIPLATGDGYAAAKLEGERICRNYSEQYAIPVTILRPTIVYGPFAPSFTLYPAELVRSGALKDYGCFSGICNPVFVDDVVDAIIHSILNPRAYNQTFIVSSGQTMSWKDFFDAYSIAIANRPMDKSNPVSYAMHAGPLRFIKEVLKLGVRLAPNLSRQVYAFLRSRGSGNWSWVKGQDVSSINLRQYSKCLTYRIDKMVSELGYEPKYNFDRGFELTKEFLRYLGYTAESNNGIGFGGNGKQVFK